MFCETDFESEQTEGNGVNDVHFFDGCNLISVNTSQCFITTSDGERSSTHPQCKSFYFTDYSNFRDVFLSKAGSLTACFKHPHTTQQICGGQPLNFKALLQRNIQNIQLLLRSEMQKTQRCQKELQNYKTRSSY